MFKKCLFLAIIFVFTFAVLGFAQQAQAPAEKAQAPVQEAATAPQAAQEVVKGTIKEIAPDSSYIVVDATKILTTKEFLEDSYLEVGDKVEITAEKTQQGLKAVDYNYVFEEETEAPIEKALPEEPIVDLPE